MHVRWLLAVVALMLLLWAGTVDGQEQSNWFSTMAPFGQASGPPTSKSGFGSRISNLRNRLPWRQNQRGKPNAFIEGNKNFFRPDLARRSEEKKRPLSWVRPATWLAPEPPPKQPQSMSDWIGLPRPGID